MSHLTVMVGRLVISVKAFRREPTGEPGVERLLVDLDVKNPVGSPGSAERMPAIEVWDDIGRVYTPLSSDEYAEPVLEDTTQHDRSHFEIPVDAMGLVLVLAPGTADEQRIELAEG